ncbi:MAG TPA: hypothetical protein VFC11_08355 [Methylocella sp.]|jgi:hypothetical protein|nr:hypothetical protein [Methylocella sp.]
MKHLEHPTKLDWAKLPPAFRRIRLELAREKGHPEGSALIGYTLIAPLDAEGRIDLNLWHEYHDFCRVVRFRPNEADDIGHLVRKPGGAWAFRYDVGGDQADETGYHFSSDRFAIGDYVSVREDDNLHTFQVASVEPV